MKIDPVKIPKSIIYFSNITLVFLIFFSLGLVFLSIFKIYNPPENVSLKFYISTIFFGLILFFLTMFFIKKLNAFQKANISLVIFVLFTMLYAFEIYLMFNIKEDHSKIRQKLAQQKNITFDTRSFSQVLDKLKTTGYERVYPNILPSELYSSEYFSKFVKEKKNKQFLPLSSISNSNTILQNQSGYYPIITTDEHGFNNPKGLYKSNFLDVILIGDSFTEGNGVNSDKNIQSNLRNKGLNTLSLGKLGNGPLIEYAILREYAKPLKPKAVFWMYYSNDITDLFHELKSPILKKYLENDSFSQNLISKQNEIDNVLIDFTKFHYLLTKDQIQNTKKNKDITAIFKLGNLRKMINLKPQLESSPEFEKILIKSKKLTSSWGGKFYFVYLPPFLKNPKDINKYDMYREYVLDVAERLNIPIIDLYEEIYQKHPDPLSLFPLRYFGNNNEVGYNFIAKKINKILIND